MSGFSGESGRAQAEKLVSDGFSEFVAQLEKKCFLSQDLENLLRLCFYRGALSGVKSAKFMANFMEDSAENYGSILRKEWRNA